MTDETQALPNAESAAASSAELEANRAIDENANDGELTTEQEAEAKVKPEKTPEQREIERLRRGIDRRTRQLSEARAQLDLTHSKNDVPYQQSTNDSEPLSLTRAELAEMVKAEAHRLAPTFLEQATETERRQSVVQSLAKTWGQDRFDQLSSDLDDAFGGLTERSGQPKPATEAIFEADEPAKVIEWLADPDNIDESERISRMTSAQAGKAIAKLEARMAIEAKDKPKPSKAAVPLESVKGAAPVKKALIELSGDDFDKRRREQIKARG
jgi:hypothetical protein